MNYLRARYPDSKTFRPDIVVLNCSKQKMDWDFKAKILGDPWFLHNHSPPLVFTSCFLVFFLPSCRALREKMRKRRAQLEVI